MKNTVPFPDKGCETYQPVLVKVNYWFQLEQVHEWIFLDRYLTEEEQKRLQKAKTRNKVDDLVDNIREINEPEIYEVNIEG